MTEGDLAIMADKLADIKRSEEEDRFKRVVRAIQTNGALTAIQVAEVERMHVWDVLAAMTTLSEQGRLIHSHTTHSGEEAWMVKGD